MSTESDRVTAHERIEDHRSSGLALFYRQFKNATKLQALVGAWLTQIQAIEDALFDTLSITLDNATGDQLTQYGALLLFSQGSLTEAAYRAILKAIVRARKSSATPEDIIAVAGLALSGAGLSYREGYASVLVEPDDVLTYEAAALRFVLHLAKAAGVQLQVIYRYSGGLAPSSPFAFSPQPLLLFSSSSSGFADTTQTSGGRLTGVL